MKKLLITLFLLTLFTSGNTLKAQTDYSYYAMFLYNFVKYTEWPGGNNQVTIGVLNNAEAGTALSKVANAKAMVVKNFKLNEDLSACHILFIPSNNASALSKVLDKVKGKPVLVVTEVSDLTRKGAGISFKVVNEKMKFQVNQEVIRTSGLKMSNNLIALAVN